MTAMHCICCDKKLETCGPYPYQPGYAVMCYTSGNYGSQVFDAFEGERILFFVCDECLVRKQEKVLVFDHADAEPYSGALYFTKTTVPM